MTSRKVHPKTSLRGSEKTNNPGKSINTQDNKNQLNLTIAALEQQLVSKNQECVQLSLKITSQAEEINNLTIQLQELTTLQSTFNETNGLFEQEKSLLSNEKLQLSQQLATANQQIKQLQQATLQQSGNNHLQTQLQTATNRVESLELQLQQATLQQTTSPWILKIFIAILILAIGIFIGNSIHSFNNPTDTFENTVNDFFSNKST